MTVLDDEKEKALVNARHGMGIYSILELCAMFNCSRYSIDNAINAKKLNYMSPNNRDRYLYLKDFLAYMDSERGSGKR